MSNFFKQAPAHDTDQKRLLEALRQGRHVIASFPLNYADVSLYALPAMMGDGMAVVVCPNSMQIHRYLDYFKKAGFSFPNVTYLDGTQMPQEERAIESEINRNRVKLLYITPERFASLTFLEVLVHTRISFLAIEEAERLLPSMPGYGLYKRFYEDGLGLLRQLPPLVLLVPPLSPLRLRELSERLSLGPCHFIQMPPVIQGTELRVEKLMTEHQKFRLLVRSLSGNPGRGRLGRLHETGSVLIQTAYPAQAEKLGTALSNYGFESVWVNHYKKAPRDQAMISDIVVNKLDTVVVNAGIEPRFWVPPPEARPRVVFWSPPASVEDLFIQVFRQTESLVSGYGLQHLTRGLVLHTREDWETALRRLNSNRYLNEEEIRQRTAALKKYREWVLSPECRLQAMFALMQDPASSAESGGLLLPPCGQCDRCREAAQPKRSADQWVRRTFQQWLY